MITKPTSHLDWILANPGFGTEPSTSEKNAGWNISQRPSKEFMNWLFLRADEWNKYLEQETDLFKNNKTVVVNSVAAEGNFLTLQAAHDDAGVGPGTKIIVTSDLTIGANVQISKQDLEIEWRPGYKVISSGGVTRGLEIVSTANRLILKNPWFQGFTGVGESAIWLDVGATNVYFNRLMFDAGLTNNITDNTNSSYVEHATMEL